ncbi:ferredoxin [Umezawaea sp.]|uniref:ferredoxin n=1 Tax=Umezawaea sp. TaxID=1955258 RepID=UPI002ED3A7DF
MRIVLDRAKCTGIGICESLAPEVFEVDANGDLAVLRVEVPSSAEADVAAAVEGCPTQALKFEA